MSRLTDYKDYIADKAEYERHLSQGYPRNIGRERFLKLAEYENLEEQGKLIKLPYALGKVKTLYCIDERCHDIFELNASAIEISVMSNNKVVYTIDCTDFCREDFGKIVFRTEKEAEAKLKELKGE